MKTWLAYDILNSLPHCWESMPETKPIKNEYMTELKNFNLVTENTESTGPILTLKGEEFLNFRGDLHQIEYLGRPVLLCEDVPLDTVMGLFDAYMKKVDKDVNLSLTRIRYYRQHLKQNERN